jgi:hypothetical protein
VDGKEHPTIDERPDFGPGDADRAEPLDRGDSPSWPRRFVEPVISDWTIMG